MITWLYTDLEGKVPLWEAMVNQHQNIIKLLIDNGANIGSGDLGHLACTAAEQNNLDLLKDIVRYGGNVTIPKSDGYTALHVAVTEGNVDIVKFLLDQGADIDKLSDNGWSPRSLADQQAHEEIQALFQSKEEIRHPPSSIVHVQMKRPMAKFKSEPSMRPPSLEGTPTNGMFGDSRRRRKTSNFHNSIFGMMSAAQATDKGPLSSMNSFNGGSIGNYSIRVTISCPEKGDVSGKLVLLPGSLEELLELGAKKFDILASKVLTLDRAEIDDIALIRDGDHIILASENNVRN